MRDQERRKSRVDILSIIVIVIILLIVANMILTLTYQRHSASETMASLEQIRAELPRARERWENSRITDYDIDVEGHIPVSNCDIFLGNPNTVHVRYGKVQPNLSECDTIYARFLAPDGFAELKKELDKLGPDDPDYLKVTFDPECGFITYYLRDCNLGSVGDCIITYQYTNFQPIK